MGDASIVGLRAWEIACVATWAVGVWLVWRLGAGRPNKFSIGLSPAPRRWSSGTG